MSSRVDLVADRTQLSDTICRVMHQVALQEHFVSELVETPDDQPITATLRDSLIATLETSAAASRALIEATDAMERQKAEKPAA